MFVLVTTTSSPLLTGFTFHVVAIFGEAGLGRSVALAVFFPAAIVSVLITPLVNIASDYMQLKYFAVAHGIALGFFMLCLPLLPQGASMYVALIVSKGLATAMFGVNQTVVWPRFFGLTHLGAITGFATAWFVGGSAVGPYIYSLSLQLTGSFLWVSYIFAPLCIVLGLLGLRADNPN